MQTNESPKFNREVSMPGQAKEILGNIPPAQEAYIGKVGELRSQATELAERQAAIASGVDTSATDIDGKLTQAEQRSRGAEIGRALEDNALKLAQTQRFAFLRTNGGLSTDEPDVRARRQTYLAHAETFEGLRASDLGMLASDTGYDLVPLCMAYRGEKKNQTPSSSSIAAGDRLVTNFGNNGRINSTIGCADILPPTVKRVKIDGKEGILLTGDPELDKLTAPADMYQAAGSYGVRRPGYYAYVAGRWDYLPIYHGTEVEVLETRTLDQGQLDAYAAARRERNELVRMWDVMDNGGKPLSDSPADIALAEKAKKLAAEGKLGTPASPEGLRAVHNVGDLDFEGRKRAAVEVFGSGPATSLLLAYEERYGQPDIRMQTAGLTGPSGIGMARMIALAYHEGGLVFGRQNPDPASGYNIGTFQIGGAGSTPETSMRKYHDCLACGASMAGISADAALGLPPGQRDLLAHMGYIESQRGGAETFAKLFDPNLGYNETVRLMHNTIQGGIRAIGEHVWSLTQPTASSEAIA